MDCSSRKMHTSTAHMMAMANTFWPFAYTFRKSYDLGVNPAFLSTAYGTIPGMTTSPYCSQTNAHSSSPTQAKKPDHKFSIDAILNKDNYRDSSDRTDAHDSKRSPTCVATIDKLDDSAISRRHHRLLEASHPYLNHVSHYTDVQQQQHQQQKINDTPYRHLTDSQKHINTGMLHLFFILVQKSMDEFIVRRILESIVYMLQQFCFIKFKQAFSLRIYFLV